MKRIFKLTAFLLIIFGILFHFSMINIYATQEEGIENSISLEENEDISYEEEYDSTVNYVEEYETQAQNSNVQEPYSRARVLRVLDETVDENEYSGGSISTNIQLLEVHILNGRHSGKTVQAEYELNYAFHENYKTAPLSEGDEVLLYLQENSEGALEKAYVAEIARDSYLLYLVIGFLLLLLLVGRLKGLKAIISLVLTAFAVIKILLPAILKGYDPIFISVAVCIGIIGITLVIISGLNKKTLSAIIGTAGGVIAAGIIALIVGSLAKLTGFGDNESQMLMYIPNDIQFDFRGLLFAGIIIGTMGATMDVGMTIASAMHEIKANSPGIKTADLFRAGMNIGRDAMATMTNTLILAYAGSSLHLMLLFMAHETPFAHIINWDIIASEVLRAIAGSMGIVFAIPITAFASAFIEERKQKNKHNMQGYSIQ